MRRYKVIFDGMDGRLVLPAALMDAGTLTKYADYLASPRHAELRQLLRDPGPDQFHVETIEVAEHSYLDGLAPEALITRRA